MDARTARGAPPGHPNPPVGRPGLLVSVTGGALLSLNLPILEPISRSKPIGFAIGGGLFGVICAFGALSVAFSPDRWAIAPNWIFWIAPILGGLLAAAVERTLRPTAS